MPRPGLPTRFCNLNRLAALCLMMIWPLSGHAECGLAHPDYSAERTVRVGGKVARMHVYVSGLKVREEADLGRGVRVTIRDPNHGRAVAFDPATRQGAALPQPIGPRLPSRHEDETTPDGSRTRILEVEKEGRWLDLSRTTCRKDGIMTHQSFVSLDAAGREVTGTVEQDEILVAPQSPSLFELPAGLGEQGGSE